MANNNEVETSLTLLKRLRQTPCQQEAWATFWQRYRPMMKAWCRRWGLNWVDADDVVNDLMVKLLDKDLFQHFDLSRNFRPWLKTVVHNVVTDHLRRQQRRPGDRGRGGADSDEQLVRIGTSVEEFAGEVAEDVEKKLQQAQRIAEAVKAKVQAKTWEAYVLQQEGVPAQEVAQRLGMNVASVYKAHSNVSKRLLDEGRKASAEEATGGEDGDG